MEKKIRCLFTLFICMLLVLGSIPNTILADSVSANEDVLQSEVLDGNIPESYPVKIGTPLRSRDDVSNSNDLAYSMTVSFGDQKTEIYTVTKPKGGAADIVNIGTTTVPAETAIYVEITFDKDFDASGVGAGDYFTIELPRDVFIFSDVTNKSLVYQGDIFGFWSLTDSVIKVTFNENAAASQNVNGTISLAGEAAENNENETITYPDGGSITIVTQTGPPAEQPLEGVDKPESEGQLFGKYGYQSSSGSENIVWELNVNSDMMAAMVAGQTPQTRHNIWIEDTLSAEVYDLTSDTPPSGGVERVTVNAIFQRLNRSGQWTGEWGGNLYIGDQFTMKNGTGTAADYAAFKTAIQNSGQATVFIFNITADGTSEGTLEGKMVGLYVSSIPGSGLVVAADETQFKEGLRRSNRLSESEIQRYYDFCSANNMEPIHIRLAFKVAIKDPDAVETVTNEATVTYDNNQTETARHRVEIKSHDSQIIALPPGSVSLVKQDEQGNALAGAVFYLERQNSQLSWDIVPATEKTTDSAGKILITGLRDGIYRFTEKQAAPGYTISGGQITPGEFTISMENDTAGIAVTAVNKRLLGSVRIEKTSSSGKRLSGAKFICTKVQQGQICYYSVDQSGQISWNRAKENAYQLTTDENGMIQIDNLDWDSYTFEEVAAPRGFILDTAAQSVTINADYVSGAVQTLHFINAPVITNPPKSDSNQKVKVPAAGRSIPRTGDDSMVWLWMTIGCASLLTCWGLWGRRRRKNSGDGKL